jgi:multidrug resistance efflux pump
MRLRVVAPCQVVAKEPAVVAAPLQGVIDRIVVEPGRRVEPGDLLFRYDRRVADKELTIVRQQLAIRQAQLTQARMGAFHDPAVRAGLPSLEARVAQDRVRLQLAESQAEQLDVRARRAGLVRIEEPHAWRGRAVDVGERVLMIVDPDRTMARIWVPEGDMIRFDRDEPVRVVLNVRPGDALLARITYASSHAQPSPKGVHGFVVEADWAEGAPSVRLGLEGTAVLYGSQEVCLAYWLLRKPLAAVRRWFGV